MKTNRSDLETSYVHPVAVPVEVSLEGILCASSENEDYEGSENYGDDSDANKGWY